MSVPVEPYPVSSLRPRPLKVWLAVEREKKLGYERVSFRK
jgi:hypothetical protein